MNRLRDERGTILALSAVMIPVFLLLAALVIDVGNWYTHKRQLQKKAVQKIANVAADTIKFAAK